MVKKRLFGKTSVFEKKVYEYVIENEYLQVHLLDYGATIRKIIYKGKDVVLGFDDLKSYENNTNYIGSTIGPVSGRIKDAKFFLNQELIKWDKNENKKNNLHSGVYGLHNYIFESKIDSKSNRVIFNTHIHSEEDNDEYYRPVSLNYDYDVVFFVEYVLGESSLVINYFYSSMNDNIASLTNHTYFNLSEKEDIKTHKLKLYSDYITPCKNMIPTGEISKIKGTAFDFKREKSIGDMMKKYKDVLEETNGYDHNFVSKLGINGSYRLNATLKSDDIILNIFSTYPCFQVYTGNFIENVVGKNGKIYNKNAGIAIEPQYAPNAINIPHFAQPIIRGSVMYEHGIIYEFSSK